MRIVFGKAVSVSIAKVDFRPSHSMSINATIMISSFLGKTVGACKILADSMISMKCTASCKLFDLKKIQARTVHAKVKVICPTSFNVGHTRSCPTMSMFCLLVLKTIDGNTKTAFSAPQMINVQLAPCQNPLIRKMMKVFRTCSQSFPLLPPIGI